MTTTRIALLCLLLLTLHACAESGGAASRHNILLVTLDTLRADHLSCYGAENVQTPVIDGIAEQGILFTNAAAPVPLTLPSHSSLFTGTYPLSHGVRDNLGYVLSDEEVTLAEVLRDAGWRTAGFIAAYVLHSTFGIGQGFDHYADEFDFERKGIVSTATVQRRGDEVVEASLAWLEEHHEDPFFLWIHLFDPHVPYAPPEPYRSLYASDLYAGEVAYTDMLMGLVMDRVKALNLLENTIIVILGDHGEGRGDHQESFHGLFVYDSTIRVPLIIRAPAYTPLEVDAQVRIIDVMPTLLDLAGLPLHPAEDGGLLEGRSLEPLMSAKSDDLKLFAYSETHHPTSHYGWSDLKSLRTSDYKYIQAPRPELYDLSADPGEVTDVRASMPEVADRMWRTLDEMEKRAGPPRSSRMEADQGEAKTAEALRQLGYTGSVAQGAVNEGELLPDPKDKVEVLLTLEAAQRLIATGQSHKAVPLLRKVVNQDPQMMDARITLGIALFKIKEFDVAANVFTKSIELSPDMFAAWVNLGLCLRELKREAEASNALERALELNPGNLEVMGHLIESCFAMKKYEKTEEISREYLEMKPDAARVRVALGLSLLNRGRLNEAREEVEAGLEIDEKGENLHYVLGNIHERRRNWPKAAEAYEREHALRPGSANVCKSLAGVYQQMGRWKEMITVLESAVEKNPQSFDFHLMLAKAYLGTGVAKERSLEVARRAVELNSSSQEAWDTLGALETLK